MTQCGNFHPPTQFPCEFCDTRLETKVAWGAHMWKHTKDVKYIIVDAKANAKDKVREKKAKTPPLNLASAS